MARRPSKHLRPPRPLGSGHAAAVTKTDGRWIVRRLAGATVVKDYRCPGCAQLILAGSPHVVAWPAEAAPGRTAGVEERRHWHTACWERRR